MDQRAIGFRHATEMDQRAIRALVHSERLNPLGINWQNFLVAAVGERIVGAAQIRKHSDGSRELGSLVVARDARGHGVASRMIDTLLSEDREPIWLVTTEQFAGAYASWGFQRIEPRAAPVRVRHNYRMGSMARIISFVMRWPMRRLVILERLPHGGRPGGRSMPGSLGHRF